jgi:phage-related minor tail protein
MSDLKIQGEVTFDTTSADQALGDVEQRANRMAQSVSQAGDKAGKAVSGIGDGGEQSSQKVDAATRSMIQSIQRTTAAMEAGSKSSAQYYTALAQQRGISTDALAPYLAQLDAAKAKQDAAADSMAGVASAAQKFMQSLQGQTQALKDEAATFGLSKTELLAYQAAKLGIAEAAAPLIAQISREETALKALRESTLSANAAVNAFGETEAQAAARIGDMVARSRDAQAAMNATASAATSGAAGFSAFNASAEQTRATISAQTAAMSQTTREMASINEQMDIFRATAAQGTTSFQTLYAQFDRLDLLMAKGKLTMEEYDAAAGALWKDEERLQQQVGALVGRYDPLNAANQKLVASQSLLEDAYKNGQVSADQYAKALAGIQADKAVVQLKELAQQEAQLEKSLKSGQVSWSDYKKSLADINASKSGLKEIVAGANDGASAMDGLGTHTKAARTEFLRLVNDVATGNFGRFEQSAMVLAEQMDLLGAVTSPLALGFAAVAVSVGAFAVAAYKGYEESDRLNKALASTSNYAGLTAGQIDAMAQSLGASTGRVTEAEKALTALAASGKFSGSELESVAAAAMAMSEATGESADTVVKQFVAMADDVTKGAAKMNEQYHFLTLAQYDEIKALEEHGDKAGAMKVAADALTSSLEKQKVPLSGLPKLLKEAETSWSDFWRAAMNAGKSDSPADAVNSARAAVEDFQTQIAGLKSAGVTPNASVMDHLASLQANLAAAGQEAALHADSAGIQSMLAEQQQAGMVASQKISEMQKNLRSREQIRDDEITSIHKYYAAARAAAQANPDQLDPANYSEAAENATVAAAVANSAKGGSSKAAKAADAQEAAYSSQAAAIQADIAAQQQQLALMDKYGVSVGKVSEQDKRVLEIEQQLALAQKDRPGKLSDAQEQDLLQKAQQAKALADQVEKQKEYNALTTKWAESEDAARAGLADDLAMYGAEGETRKAMAVTLQYEADARKMLDAERAKGIKVTQEDISNAMREADARASVINSVNAQRDALAGAWELEKQHEQFQANSIADAQQRADALTAIEAKKWQDLIQQAGDGTEAQKKLIAAYEQWLVDQEQSYNIQQWKSLVDGIGTDFHNGFFQMLSDGEAGWKSFTKSLANTFEVTVVNALYEAFAKKWVIQVVAEIAGVTQGDAVKNALLGTNNTDGTSVSQLLASGGSLKSLYDWAAAKSAIGDATNGVSSVTGSSLGYNVGSASSYYSGGGDSYNFSGAGLGYNSTGSSNLLGTGISGSDALGALGSAASGYGIGKVIGGTTGSEVGGSLGALAGSFAIPIPVLGTVIGGVVGSVLGKVVGGLFGSGETRYGGVYSTTDGTAANTSKVGTGPSGSMNATESSTTIGNVDLTYNTIKTLAGALGGSVDGLGTYHAGWELSPSKGNSWVEAGFVQNLSDTSDRTQLSGVKDADTVATDFTLELQRSIVKSLQLANLDKPYADYLAQFNASTLTADDVTNIENELQTMKAFFDTVKALGPSFANLKNAGTSAQAAIADLAGGMDTLSSELSYYSQNFTTTQEQYATQAANVQAQLDALGEGSVKTKDQFKSVVESLDLTTDAGQSLYQSMLALAPAFEQMIENADAVAQAAQQAADAQQSLWDNYFGAVYDSSQQLAMAQSQMQAKFDALGVAMPQTNAEFEALVENMDTSTQPMKDLQNALLALAPAFGQMTSAADQAAQQAAQTAQEAAQAQASAIQSALQDVQTAYDNQTQAIQSTIDSLQQFIKTIGDFKNSLALGDLSTLTPEQKYQQAKQQFESVSSAAAGGDTTAQGQLTQAAQDFLTASRDYNASNTGYAADYEEVQKALDANTSAAEQQLTMAQQTLAADQQMVQGILDLNQTTQSLADALKAYFAAQVAAGQAASGTSGSLGTGLDYTQANGVVDYGNSGGYTLSSGGGITFTGVSDANLLAAGQQVADAYQYIDPVRNAMSSMVHDFANMGEWSAAESAAIAAYQNGASLQDAIDQALKVNGSHAGGLDSVPFDGYRAELHKGEAVVTSANNQKLSRLLSGDYSGYGSESTTALIQEIQALRSEVQSLRQTSQQIGLAQLDQSAKQHVEQQTTLEKSRKALNNVESNTR